MRHLETDIMKHSRARAVLAWGVAVCAGVGLGSVRADFSYYTTPSIVTGVANTNLSYATVINTSFTAPSQDAGSYLWFNTPSYGSGFPLSSADVSLVGSHGTVATSSAIPVQPAVTFNFQGNHNYLSTDKLTVGVDLSVKGPTDTSYTTTTLHAVVLSDLMSARSGSISIMTFQPTMLTVGNTTYDVSLLGGNSGLYLNLQPVPEPGSLALLGLGGLAALGGRRWMRTRAA